MAGIKSSVTSNQKSAAVVKNKSQTPVSDVKLRSTPTNLQKRLALTRNSGQLARTTRPITKDVKKETNQPEKNVVRVAATTTNLPTANKSYTKVIIIDKYLLICNVLNVNNIIITT